LLKVLLIEPSATIRHIQENILLKQGFEVETVSDFASGLELIETEDTPYSYDAFFIGWPAAYSIDLNRLLNILSDEQYSTTPILILAHEDRQEAKEHASQKYNTIHIPWSEHKRSAEILAHHYSRLANADFDTKTHLQPIRILFVDDSRTVRHKYKKLLRDNGYHVDVAESADTGFKQAIKSDFDIAIVDYFMPDTNGDELCKKLQDDPRTNSITSSLITGTYLDYAIESSLKSGAVECMFKNESDDLFIARVDAMSRHIRARKSIERERKRLSGILRSVGDGVFGVDYYGNITFINPSCMHILGYDKGDSLIGKCAHNLFHHSSDVDAPLEKEKCELNNAFKHGYTINQQQTVFWRKTGEPIPIEYTVYPFSIDTKRQGSVVAFRDISERIALEKELRWQADHDPLTKLANRRRFEMNLSRELDRLKRSKDCSALLYIDLDRFKYVNDTAGHAAGDQLLIEISQLLASRLRKADDLARLGGDEFAILLKSVSKTSIKQTADEYRHLLEQYLFLHDNKQFNINASIGIAIIDRDTTNTESALSNADMACHIAKKHGRNQVHIYIPEVDIHENKDLGWSLQITNALDNNLFLLNYQPIYSCKQLKLELSNSPEQDKRELQSHTSSETQIIEALLRIEDGRQEIIYPNAFLPTAERLNMMGKIDTWVVEHALAQLKQFQQQGFMGQLSINLSNQTVAEPHVVNTIEQLIVESKIDTSKIIFEISETTAASTSLQTQELVYRMNNLGCQIALDDFGSGFFAFSQLKQLPVNFIKISSQLVLGIRNNYNQAVIKSINDVAHSLNIKTIANHVKDMTALNFLLETGIDHVQGFLLSKPIPDPTIDGNKENSKNTTTN